MAVDDIRVFISGTFQKDCVLELIFCMDCLLQDCVPEDIILSDCLFGCGNDKNLILLALHAISKFIKICDGIEF